MTTADILQHLRERDAQRHIPGGYELLNALVDRDVLAVAIALLESHEAALGRLCQELQMRDIVSQRSADTRRDAEEWRKWATAVDGWEYWNKRRAREQQRPLENHGSRAGATREQADGQLEMVL